VWEDCDHLGLRAVLVGQEPHKELGHLKVPFLGGKIGREYTGLVFGVEHDLGLLQEEGGNLHVAIGTGKVEGRVEGVVEGVDVDLGVGDEIPDHVDLTVIDGGLKWGHIVGHEVGINQGVLQEKLDQLEVAPRAGHVEGCWVESGGEEVVRGNEPGGASAGRDRVYVQLAVLEQRLHHAESTPLAGVVEPRGSKPFVWPVDIRLLVREHFCDGLVGARPAGLNKLLVKGLFRHEEEVEV